MLIVAFLLAFQIASPAPDPAPPSPEPSSGTASLDVLTDDRQSLAGISRLLLTLNIPDELQAEIDTDVLRSTVTFALEQAGLEMVATRNVDDPILVVSLRVVPDAATPGGRPRRLYRVDADLFQLVRIPDHAGGTRLMMASTWHAGSFGAVDDIALPSLRDRVTGLVETFVSDWRGVNAP